MNCIIGSKKTVIGARYTVLSLLAKKMIDAAVKFHNPSGQQRIALLQGIKSLKTLTFTKKAH